MRIIDAVLANMNRPLDDLRADCREHWDANLARYVCMVRIFPQVNDADLVVSLPGFLALFRQDSSQQEFLAFYLEELKNKVAGQAPCGCVNHAEEGRACEHDLLLLGPPRA